MAMIPCLMMRENPTNPRQEAITGSVKWITPWAECTMIVYSGGVLASMGSGSFSHDEWLRFCSLVNKQVNKITKDK